MLDRVAFLTREEEIDLAIRWKDQKDERAMHRLVMAHQPMVKKIARKVRRRMSYDDAVQVANVGLLIAAQRFDPSRGFRFCTMASWWVRAYVSDALIRNGAVTGPLDAKGKRAFHAGELIQVFSLEMPIDDVPIGDTLVCPNELPDEVMEKRFDGEVNGKRLQTAMQKLNKRERSIFEARYLSEDTQTHEALGSVHGVTKERIRQIAKGALDKVQRAMNGEDVAKVRVPTKPTKLRNRQEEILSYLIGLGPVGTTVEIARKTLYADCGFKNDQTYYDAIRALTKGGYIRCVGGSAGTTGPIVVLNRGHL